MSDNSNVFHRVPVRHHVPVFHIGQRREFFSEPVCRRSSNPQVSTDSIANTAKLTVTINLFTMPRRTTTTSARVKLKQDQTFEKQISDAKNDLATGKCLTISEASELHGVAESTLRGRLNGKRSKQQSRIDQQKLTPAEENAIKGWIFKLDDWGFPPRHQYVKDMALDFIKSHGVAAPKLGKNWLTRFLSRHPDLASKFCTRLDKQRAFADSPEVIQDFYEKVFVLLLYQLSPY
jgi:hypothetical protein